MTGDEQGNVRVFSLAALFTETGLQRVSDLRAKRAQPQDASRVCVEGAAAASSA